MVNLEPLISVILVPLPYGPPLRKSPTLTLITGSTLSVSSPAFTVSVTSISSSSMLSTSGTISSSPAIFAISHSISTASGPCLSLGQVNPSGLLSLVGGGGCGVNSLGMMSPKNTCGNSILRLYLSWSSVKSLITIVHCGRSKKVCLIDIGCPVLGS